ncbi:MAG TPA: glycosyltransferase family 1 protein [Anaerolineae bacterium]|nr:glycosyltransferase family 1 protein [Anaerolineae bacterium]HIP71581.1 glycosyltransferase family 1 protein [Anaerolineae bacterium]
MTRPLRVLYYNTFLPMNSSEGMVSRQFLAAARRLPDWELTTVPPYRETAVSANGAAPRRRKYAPAVLRRVARSFLSPISPYPIGPYLHARRMRERLTAVLHQNEPFDLAFFHLAQGDLAVLAETHARIHAPLVLRVPAPLAYEADYVLHRYMSRQDRQREQFLYAEAAAILVISTGMKQILAESGVTPEKIFVYPNGVDTAAFDPEAARRAEMRRELGLDGRKVVGYVGSFWPGNDVNTLLQAWRQVEAVEPTAVLLLVGDGVKLVEARRQSEQLRLQNCRWLGRIPHTAVPDVMAAMDVAVGPYGREALTFVSPLKVMEYAAMARPVVAADGGQIREIVQDGVTGHLYEPENAVQLTAKILTLLADPPTAVAMGRRARVLMQDWYSWDKVAADVMKLCRNVAAGKAEPPAALPGQVATVV